jgi:hypothetical protein
MKPEDHLDEKNNPPYTTSEKKNQEDSMNCMEHHQSERNDVVSCSL